MTDIYKITRPHPNLLKYYAVFSALFGPLFPFLFVPHWIRYRTLRYTFDEEGVTMRWGALFRRETRLNYTRLQDIHLASNAVERRFGLARVQLQTASGSAKPEMTLEGIQQYDEVRDFLYRRMQGDRDESSDPALATGELEPVITGLRQVATELGAIRRLLEERGSRRDGP